MAGLTSKFRLSLRHGEQAFQAGYSAGFGPAVTLITAPQIWVVRKVSEKYIAGFKAGQFDYKIEKI